MRRPIPALAVTALLSGILLVGGCSPSSDTVVINEPAPETTGTLTPLERGEIRRYVENGAEAAIAAWLSGDRERFTEHFGDFPQELLLTRWDEAERTGSTVEREHERISLAIIEMNDTGTQALAKYRFRDFTVVRDQEGNVVTDRDGAEAEFQFTMEPTPDDPEVWIVVRMIGTADSLN